MSIFLSFGELLSVFENVGHFAWPAGVWTEGPEMHHWRCVSIFLWQQGLCDRVVFGMEGSFIFPMSMCVAQLWRSM